MKLARVQSERRECLASMKPSDSRLFLVAIYVAFLCKGFFYSVVIPIWEGYDEYAHFAFIQHVAEKHELPVPHTTISREIERSLELAPLPWELRDLQPPHLTHDSFWKLGPRERLSRQQDLMSIHGSGRSEAGSTILYEGKQGPLYYWLMWPLYRLIGNMTIPDGVLILRLVNILLASLVIPITFAAAQNLFGDTRSSIAVCALVASMPELYMDAFRVGNQSLAMILYSLFTLFCLRAIDSKPNYIPLAGVTLGLLLITRAYSLAAIPALLLVAGYAVLNKKPVSRSRVLLLDAAAFAAAAAIACWWYIRNLRLGGSLIWYDSAPSRPIGLQGIVRHAFTVHWRDALESVFGSHIWFGNWSFLTVRSWMYQVFQVAALISIVGFGIAMLRKKYPTIKSALLVTIYGMFVLSIAYHVLMNSINLGIDASAGWYLYAVIVAEAVLVTAGILVFRFGRAMLAAVVGCFALLELYTMHFVLIPYYTGLIAHAPDGGLQSFHLSQLTTTTSIGEIIARLGINRPSIPDPILIVLWFLFLAGCLTPLYVVVSVCLRKVSYSN